MHDAIAEDDVMSFNSGWTLRIRLDTNEIMNGFININRVGKNYIGISMNTLIIITYPNPYSRSRMSQRRSQELILKNS